MRSNMSAVISFSTEELNLSELNFAMVWVLENELHLRCLRDWDLELLHFPSLAVPLQVKALDIFPLLVLESRHINCLRISFTAIICRLKAKASYLVFFVFEIYLDPRFVNASQPLVPSILARLDQILANFLPCFMAMLSSHNRCFGTHLNLFLLVNWN